MINLKAAAKKKEEEDAASKKVEEEDDGAGAGAGTGGAARAAGRGAGRGKVKLRGVAGRGRGKTGGGGGRGRTAPHEARLMKEMTELSKLNLGDAAKIVWPDPDVITKMRVTISPEKHYWAGASYDFSIEVTSDYPHEPPKVHCDTKIYHPNIDLAGKVCLNILRADWRPIYDVAAVVNGLIFLFYDPNPNDPLNKEAAAVFRDDVGTFERNVQRSLRGYAVAGESFPRLI